MRLLLGLKSLERLHKSRATTPQWGTTVAVILLIAGGARSLAAVVPTQMVDLTNANFSWEISPLSETGLPPDESDFRELTVSYNSRSLYQGAFGIGWCSEYESRLAMRPYGDPTYFDFGCGEQVTFHSDDSGALRERLISTILMTVKGFHPEKPESYFANLRQQLEIDDDELSEFAVRLKFARPLTTFPENRTLATDNGYTLTRRGDYFHVSKPDGNVLIFDGAGRLVQIVEVRGDVVGLHYTGAHLLAITSNGRPLMQFAYDPYGRIRRVFKEGSGAAATFFYLRMSGANAWYELTSIAKTDQRPFRFEYTAVSLSRVTSPSGAVLKVRYDVDHDWAIGATDEAGCDETYRYWSDARGDITGYVKRCSGQLLHHGWIRYSYLDPLQTRMAIRGAADGRPFELIDEPGGFLRFLDHGSVATTTLDVHGEAVRVMGPNTMTIRRFHPSCQGVRLAKDRTRTAAVLYDTQCIAREIISSAVAAVRIEYDAGGHPMAAVGTDGASVRLSYGIGTELSAATLWRSGKLDARMRIDHDDLVPVKGLGRDIGQLRKVVDLLWWTGVLPDGPYRRLVPDSDMIGKVTCDCRLLQNALVR